MTGKHRTNPPLRLEESPLILVLGVIRISPILMMEKFIPQIQEELRREFPHARRAETRQIQLVPDVQVGVSTKWIFADRDSKNAISISPNAIALQSIAYETFDTFIDRLARAADVVGRVARASVVDRLGLRFIDLIRPLPGGSASDLLAPALHGLGKKEFRALEVFQRHEFLCRTPEGFLVVRTFEPTDDSLLPPDLAGSDLPLNLQRAPGERVTLIDIDHFNEGLVDFEVASITEKLWKLHDYCDTAFRSTTTEEARRKVWKGQDVVPVARSS